MNNKLPHWILGHLPEYEKVEFIPQAFNDSTHQLWRLQSLRLDNKNHFLKVCSDTQSPFWQIMQGLFDFDLRTEIANFSETYVLLDNICSIEIPELIQAETLENDKAFILTSELYGSAAGSNINNQMVQQLANYLGELHASPRTTWGTFNNPRLNTLDWPIRLEASLVKSAQKWGGVFLQSDKYLNQALDACALIKATQFVPMMPDLRWDQFLQQDGVITALVDLDAFVFAPRELDFVILEYLLSSAQVSIFSDAYSKHQAIPDIKQVRSAYRLLLFYMQILGEADLVDWMNKESLF